MPNLPPAFGSCLTQRLPLARPRFHFCQNRAICGDTVCARVELFCQADTHELIVAEVDGALYRDGESDRLQDVFASPATIRLLDISIG
ncbi:hypothetical protein [[Eubacterium] cellulosolvens]